MNTIKNVLEEEKKKNKVLGSELIYLINEKNEVKKRLK